MNQTLMEWHGMVGWIPEKSSETPFPTAAPYPETRQGFRSGGPVKYDGLPREEPLFCALASVVGARVLHVSATENDIRT